VTELDLNALGVWWIPLPAGDGSVNAWAIEDADGGITLLDCGCGSPETLGPLASGLAQAGATFADVRRMVLSHADPDHAGGVRLVLDRAHPDVTVHASRAQSRALAGGVARVLEIRDGDRLLFRRFRAKALLLSGHAAGLTTLFAEKEGLFFSADQLLHGAVPIATCDGEAGSRALDAYRSSLRRIGALDVRVVLPGRGAPFAGHRRVVREVLSSLALDASRELRPAVRGERGRSVESAASAA
jgi:glyoxylase-like metal-dependent hydrolase (beta-lactamase superfamily II)